jgi:hypothetical protein
MSREYRTEVTSSIVRRQANALIRRKPASFVLPYSGTSAPEEMVVTGICSASNRSAMACSLLDGAFAVGMTLYAFKIRKRRNTKAVNARGWSSQQPCDGLVPKAQNIGRHIANLLPDRMRFGKAGRESSVTE